MGAIEFETELLARGPAAAILLDADQVEQLGGGAKRFPVKATVNGYTWRTSVAPMKGEFLVGLNKEVRAGAQVEAGDTVTVQLALDTGPRTVEVPRALAAALATDPAAQAKFDALAFTHRKEYTRWIAEAKRPETREKRVQQALQMLAEGRTLS
jgi:hypothetical protein